MRNVTRPDASQLRHPQKSPREDEMTKCEYCDEWAVGEYTNKKGIIIPVCEEHENEAGGREVIYYEPAPKKSNLLVKPDSSKKKKPAPKKTYKGGEHEHRWINYGPGLPEVCNYCGESRRRGEP